MTARQRIVIVGVVILRRYLDLSSWIRPEGFARQICRWDIPPVVRHFGDGTPVPALLSVLAYQSRLYQATRHRATATHR